MYKIALSTISGKFGTGGWFQAILQRFLPPPLYDSKLAFADLTFHTLRRHLNTLAIVAQFTE